MAWLFEPHDHRALASVLAVRIPHRRIKPADEILVAYLPGPRRRLMASTTYRASLATATSCGFGQRS